MNIHQVDDEMAHLGRLIRTWAIGGGLYAALALIERKNAMSTRLWTVVKNGQEVMSGLPSKDDAYLWLQRNTPFSAVTAQAEGYRIIQREYDN